MDLLMIALEAHSDELNHHRRYELAIGCDLLGHWVLTVRYGRVGRPLHELRIGGPDVEAVQKHFTNRLRRRVSAPRRIGCSYRVREICVEPGIAPRELLPPHILAELL